MTFDQKDIEHFSYNYFGYGNLSSPIWFLGMEEGFCGQTINGTTTPLTQLDQRINAFRHFEHVVDLKETQLMLYGRVSLGDNIQSTWNYIVRTLMYLEGTHDAFISNDEKKATILSYQEKQLGNTNGEHAIIELSPFSAHGIKEWPYPEFSIRGRKCRNRSDLSDLIAERTIALNELRKKHQPKVIFCYGKTYRKEYAKLLSSNAKFTKVDLKHNDGTTTFFEMCKDDITTMILTAHPTSPYRMEGAGWLQYYGDLAKYIKSCM